MQRSASSLRVKSYVFPGKWMADAELEELHRDLCALTRQCLDELPDYGVYTKSRAAYRNRIITAVRSREDDRMIAFSAMVLWHIRLKSRKTPQPVMHLGLVLVAPEYRGKKIMYGMYHKPLVWFYVKRLFRPFWITSTTMEPVIVGSVADSFSRVHPHYEPRAASGPSEAHRDIAKAFVKEQAHEIGVWQEAVFDEDHFVIRGSSLGACSSLMLSYDEAAKYRVEACNQFCRRTIDYSRGDEILQVGRVDIASIFRSFWWFVRKVRRKLRGSRLSRPGFRRAR